MIYLPGNVIFSMSCKNMTCSSEHLRFPLKSIEKGAKKGEIFFSKGGIIDVPTLSFKSH